MFEKLLNQLQTFPDAKQKLHKVNETHNAKLEVQLETSFILGTRKTPNVLRYSEMNFAFSPLKC